MTTSTTHKKSAATKKKNPTKPSAGATQSRKRNELQTASARTTLKRVTVEESDEDDEPGHVGETLHADGDAVMELADDLSEKHSAGEDLMELTDNEDAEEDEDSEISEC